MNRVLPSLILFSMALLGSSCASHRPATQPTVAAKPPLEHEADVSPSTLIIMYDAETGSEPLLKAVKKYGADLIYEYHIIKGIAIRIPDGSDIHEAMRYFQRVKGVVSVQRDHIMHLD